MKAIILAAGKGERMGAKTENKPKCMIKYKGKAIIDYILEKFYSCGIDDINIVNIQIFLIEACWNKLFFQQKLFVQVLHL